MVLREAAKYYLADSKIFYDFPNLVKKFNGVGGLNDLVKRRGWNGSLRPQ